MNEPVAQPPGWTFTVEETSYGAWRVSGRDLQGRSVSRHGSDCDEVMRETVQDAWDLFRRSASRVSYSRE